MFAIPESIAPLLAYRAISPEQITPRLIQSGKTCRGSDVLSNGFDQLINLSRMNDAQYGYNKLPSSLKRIMMDIDQYELTPCCIGGDKSRQLFVLCRRGHLPVTLNGITGMASGLYQAKGINGFTDWLKLGQKSQSNDFWWDIQYDYMFWPAYKARFTQQFMRVLGARHSFFQ